MESVYKFVYECIGYVGDEVYCRFCVWFCLYEVVSLRFISGKVGISVDLNKWGKVKICVRYVWICRNFVDIV